jgi:carboxylesterase
MPHPQIDPIYKNGTNGAGVLVIHGFTATPDSMRPLINRLYQDKFTVYAPLLAGHGSTPEQCAETGWEDWFETVQKAYLELNSKCSKVFVAGLSLGSLLTLKLSIEFPHAFSGLACLATPLYLEKWVQTLLPVVTNTPMKNFWKFQKKLGSDIKDPVARNNFWNYDLMPLSCIKSIMVLQREVQKDLKKIGAPILLVHSRHDSTAPYDSMNAVASRVSSTVTESITLENSYHVITIDYEKDLVASKVSEFFQRFL